MSDAILDTDGTLARACELRVTPTLLAVDADSLKTVGYKPGGDLSWVYNALDVPAPLTAKSNLQVVSP